MSEANYECSTEDILIAKMALAGFVIVEHSYGPVTGQAMAVSLSWRGKAHAGWFGSRYSAALFAEDVLAGRREL